MLWEHLLILRDWMLLEMCILVDEAKNEGDRCFRLSRIEKTHMKRKLQLIKYDMSRYIYIYIYTPMGTQTLVAFVHLTVSQVNTLDSVKL